MLSLRQELSVCSAPLLVSGGQVISRKAANDPTLDICNVQTGGCEKSVQFLGPLTDAVDGMCLRGSTLLAYANSGLTSSFDVDQNVTLHTHYNKLPKDAHITGVYPTRVADGAYMVTFNAINAISFLIPNAEVAFSAPFRLDKFPEKCKGSITSVWCHPNKPLCFVSRDIGVVQVWNYAGALRTAMGRKSSDAEADEDEEAEDDDISVDMSTSAATKKYKPSTTFAPVMCLIPPGSGSMTAIHSSVDIFARLYAVVWRDVAAGSYAVVLYDIESLQKIKLTIQIDFARLQPVAGGLSQSYGSSGGVHFGPVTFHPFEPWILQCMNYVDQDTGIFRSVICALTLLSPSLDLYRQHPVPFHLSTMDVCQRSGRLILTSPTSPARRVVNIYSVAVPLPLVSQLSVASNVFSIGDSLLKSVPETALAGMNGVVGAGPARLQQHIPSILCVSPKYSVQVSKGSPFRPVQCTYEMFCMRVGEDITKKAISYLGDVPMVTESSVERNKDGSDKWFRVDPDDNVPFDGLFRPISVRTDTRGSPKADQATWSAILLGSTLKHRQSTVFAPEYDGATRVQCVGIVRFSPNVDGQSVKSETVFGNYINAIFWMQNSVTVSEAFSSSVLLLCRNGTDLKYLSIQDVGIGLTGAIGGVDVRPNTTFICSLPKKIAAMWSPELGCPNRIVMATTAAPPDLQEIFLSDVGRADFNVTTKDRVVLLPDERVVDCLWQCPPKSARQTPGSVVGDSNEVDDQLWVSSRNGLFVGVLTSHRVLILKTLPHLSICSELCYGSFSQMQSDANSAYICESTARSMEIPVSLCWIGACLSFVCESGKVEYLLPDASIVPMNSSLICRAAGLSNPDEFMTGHLCSLPRGRADSVRLVGLLPDRLLFATNPVDYSTGSTRLSVASRPIVPIEPLILGILSVAKIDGLSAHSSGNALPLLDSLIKKLLTLYLPPKPTTVAKNHGGALPDTQASLKLAIALSEFGCADMAAIAAGISLSGTDFVGIDYPRYRWISPPIKFLIALRAGLFPQAVLDLLISRPDLQELIVDPESYGSGALPHPESVLSQQMAAAARVFYTCGQVDMSRRFADLAADDLFLAVILMGCKGGNRQSAIHSLVECYKDNRSPKVLQILTILSDTSPSDIREIVLSAISIGGGNRRSSMLSGINPPLSDARVAFNDSGPLNMGDVEKQKAKHIENRGGGGLGPSTTFGVLALDILEDWMGRVKMEVLSAGGDLSNRSHGAAASAGAAGVSTFEGPATGEVAKPATWVDDVGHSKDDVVGYWRFSDAIFPDEAKFCDSGEPHCRINMQDLSKYSNTLELFADRKDRVSFETSTSAVDPGSSHDSVKSINDAVFLNGSARPPSGLKDSNNWGFRSVIGRGSALDVGMFHEDEQRNKFTFELYVYRIEDAVANREDNATHCFAKRCVGKPASSAEGSKPIWSISVNGKGSLSFSSHVGGGDDALSTPDGEINMGPTEQEPYSTWTHIAVTVDSSDISTASSSSVSLFVNGNMISKGNVRLPTFTETDLETTTLYVAPNLSGWRITELRLWVDIRSGTSIDLHKDNFLPLAEKRKRLIVYKIKGSKQFFSPYRDIVVGDAVSGTAQNDQDDDGNSPADNKKVFSNPKSLAGGSIGLSPSGAGVDAKSSNARSSLIGPPSGGGARRGSVAPPGGSLAKPPGGGIMKPPGGGIRVPPAVEGQKRGSSKADTLPKASSGVSFADSSLPKSETVVEKSVSVSSTTAPSSGWDAFGASSTAVSSTIEAPPESTAADSSLPKSETVVEKSVSVSSTTAPSSGWDAFGASSTAVSSAIEAPPESTAKSEWDAFGSPFPSGDTAIEKEVDSKPDAAGTTTRHVEVAVHGHGSLESVGVSTTDVARCIRRSMVQKGGVISAHLKNSCLVARARSGSSGEPNGLFGIKFSQDAESVISFVDGMDSGCRLVGILANKKISIFDVSSMAPEDVNGEVAFTGSLVAEQTMSVPLVFWSFRDKSCLLLVTHASIFYWSISSPIGTTHPVKLCDRIDIQDPSKWADRKVLDLSWGGQEHMWVVLTSCLRVGPDKRPASAALAAESAVVTVQQARSSNERSIVIAARGACVQREYLYFYSQSKIRKLVSLNLDKVVKPSPDKLKVVTGVSELELMSNWATEVVDTGVTGSFPAPGAFVLSLETDCVAVVTPSAMLHVLDAMTGTLLQSSQISEHSIVSSNLGGSSDGAIFCLSEKGTLYKAVCSFVQ